MVTRIQRKLFGKLLGDRRGTAEIIGSVMFLVILLFVFTNVYIWHDTASREMNNVISEKMNSPVSISNMTYGLIVTNNGGFEVRLSRLWLYNDTDTGSTDHIYVDLESNDFQDLNLRIVAGDYIRLLFVGDKTILNDDGSIRADKDSITGDILVWYSVPSSAVRCKILTTLGNMAACRFEP